MNQQIKQVTGRGVPVIGNDIDTDRIIPARFLRCVTFEGLGEQAFADDRVQAKGQHPFDLPQYQGANILVVNANFGCGSSREHAPQALARWGIQAIVGESFAEIFFGNCIAMGVPCVTAAPEAVHQLQQLLQTNPQAFASLDLSTMEVRCGEFMKWKEAPPFENGVSFSAAVNMGEGFRQMLLTGMWDNCGQLISRVEQIKSTASQLPYLQWNSFAVTN
jgi:3-isopropylmalate/(R)-2-methylmalate dehydratase small subunit